MADQTEALRPAAQPGLQGCRGVTKEHAWQDRDYAGRADIRVAISRAEDMLAQQLRFFPSPVYIEETIEWPRYGDKRMIRGGPFGSDNRWLSMNLSTGWVQAIGVEARTSIAQGVTVTYVDDDGDGYTEVATIGPIPTSFTDISEISIYFVSGDRYGSDNDLSERWRIAPIRSIISGGNLTIRAPAWMFIRPILLAGINVPDIDPNAVPSPLAATVDVYRRYTDASNTDINSSQGVVIWETRPYHGWWCFCGSCSTGSPYSGSPYDPAAVAQAAARVGIRNSKNGIVTPAEAFFNLESGTWSSINWFVCEEPDRVIIRYLAGYPNDPDGQMSRKYRQIVTILAAAELGRPLNGCAEANRVLYYWQQDLAKTGNDKELYATSADILDNPFGTRRGHVRAWRECNTNARGTGIRVG